MAGKALFIVSSDPRISPRPAEAIRIAAGVGTWKRVEVTVVLWGPAVLALAEFVDHLVDEDNFIRYLPIIGEFERPVYVEKAAPVLAELGPSPVKWEGIDADQLGALAVASDCVIRF